MVKKKSLSRFLQENCRHFASLRFYDLLNSLAAAWHLGSRSSEPTPPYLTQHSSNPVPAFCSSHYHLGKATGWRSRYSDWLRAGRPSSRSSSPGRVKDVLSTAPRHPLVSTQHTFQWAPGLKRPGCEDDHSHWHYDISVNGNIRTGQWKVDKKVRYS
jgi:hypothetical protein